MRHWHTHEEEFIYVLSGEFHHVVEFGVSNQGPSQLGSGHGPGRVVGLGLPSLVAEDDARVANLEGAGERLAGRR